MTNNTLEAETAKWAQPHAVTDIEIAFAARGPELTPDYDVLPADFTRWNGNLWVEFAEHWFSLGDPFKAFDVTGPNPGIDGDAAIRHLRVVMGTWGTKHEHKIAGAAWLMSIWFTAITKKGGARRG